MLKAYGTEAQLHAMFEIYRAFPANEKFNAEQRARNNVPIFFGAGGGARASMLCRGSLPANHADLAVASLERIDQRQLGCHGLRSFGR